MQQARPTQSVLGNLLCCGLGEQINDVTEMLGGARRKVMTPVNGGETISNGQPEQEQDWSNPFDHMRQERHNQDPSRFAQPPEEERSVVTHSPRRNVEQRDQYNTRDTSSVGEEGAGMYGRGRYDGNDRVGARRVRPISYPSSSKHNRALELQEQYIRNTDIPHDDSGTSRGTMTTEKMTKRQKENQRSKDRHIMLNRELSARALAARDAANRSKSLRQQALLVKHTESTRAKKGVTSSDVRDPETVAGMKCQVDVELEEAAKKQACAMLNDHQYKFNCKAGLAAFSVREIAFNHRKTFTTLGPIV